MTFAFRLFVLPIRENLKQFFRAAMFIGLGILFEAGIQTQFDVAIMFRLLPLVAAAAVIITFFLVWIFWLVIIWRASRERHMSMPEFVRSREFQKIFSKKSGDN